MTRRCGAEADAGAQRVFERSSRWIVGEGELVIGKRRRGSCSNAIGTASHAGSGLLDGDEQRRGERARRQRPRRRPENKDQGDGQHTCTGAVMSLWSPAVRRALCICASYGGRLVPRETRPREPQLQVVDAQDRPATAATAIPPHAQRLSAHRLHSSRPHRRHHGQARAPRSLQ